MAATVEFSDDARRMLDEELVELVDPVAHPHRLPLERLQLGEFDVEVHDAVEDLQLGLGQ